MSGGEDGMAVVLVLGRGSDEEDMCDSRNWASSSAERAPAAGAA